MSTLIVPSNYNPYSLFYIFEKIMKEYLRIVTDGEVEIEYEGDFYSMKLEDKILR